jgi:hypothetical protein
VSLGLPLSGTRQGDTVQMDVADDRESDGEWHTKDVLVAIEIEHDGEPDDEIMKAIISQELDYNIYVNNNVTYRVEVKNITFMDKLN